MAKDPRWESSAYAGIILGYLLPPGGSNLMSPQEAPKTGLCAYCAKGIKSEWDECKSCGAPNPIFEGRRM